MGLNYTLALQTKRMVDISPKPRLIEDCNDL